MSCTNPIYINSANVDNFGFATIFNPLTGTGITPSVTFDIAGYTEFKAGGEANITQINFEVTDPQENFYTATINPSDSEEQVTIENLVSGLLYFGTYHIKGTLVEANASTYVIEFDVEVCDSNFLKSNNYIQGCVNMVANCLTAKLTITDETAYIYNKKQPISVGYDAKLWIPTDEDGGLEQFDFQYLPYVKNLSGYYTGNYQLSVTSVATYELECASFLEITYKAALTKTVDCTAAICELNCCWESSVQITSGSSQKAGQMQEKLLEAQPYYMAAIGKYICGKNAEYEIGMVNNILNCDCQCRQYIIQPAPITLGNANVFGDCGTVVTKDDNGDIHIHSFSYVFAKGDPSDLGYSIVTTQINECTKKTVITFDYDVFQQNILNAIANNPTFILNWQEVLGIGGCPCDDVVIESGAELLALNTASDDFTTLQDNYFVKNDVITGVEYKDETTIAGGTIDYIKYTDQIIQQTGVIQTAGSNITLPCGVCGESITDLSGYHLITETQTDCGCVQMKECDLDTPYVDYSERYGNAYRFNPQIEEPNYTTYTEIIDGNPYTMYKIFFGDAELDNTWSAVRVAIVKVSNVGVISLHETRTIIGANFGDINTPTTNNTWGNQVGLNRPSSINLDFDEIVNGDPVLYFTTFAGYVCRAVRERSSECDERANWKVYVLASTSNSLYGMKKFIVDANGNRSFIYLNTTTEKLYAFTYDNIGSKNSASNWVSTDIQVGCIGVDSNFNVELTKNYIFTVEENKIKLTIYGGGTLIANIINPANYSEYVICNAASASATSYIDGVGSVATLARPTWIQKITVGGDERYYFGNADNDITNNYIKYSYLRYLWLEHGGDPTLPDSWTFDTDVVVNNNSILDDGSWNPDTSSNANGASKGMLVVGGTGSVAISMFIYGIKIFNFTTHAVTILSGQGSASGNLETGLYMDSQWAYELSNCQGGSGES
jgi:hypothetical protein